jgi:hypothetical protein
MRSPKRPNPSKYRQSVYWLYDGGGVAGQVVSDMAGKRLYTIMPDGSLRRRGKKK